MTTAPGPGCHSCRFGGRERADTLPGTRGSAKILVESTLKSAAGTADSAYMSAGVGPVPTLDRSSP